MIEATALRAWETFYVIVGSSAAVLTGLQFVVMALVAETESRRGPTEIDAFGTPTVVHFCVVLLLAAILSAPWPGLRSAAVAVGLIGGGGIVYGLIVTRRARRTTLYRPVLEDWIFHVVLPVVAYVMLVIAAPPLPLPRHTTWSLFAIGASSLLLLFVGVHNAWDTVTYVALGGLQPATVETESPPALEDAVQEPAASTNL
jgi:hypothetical protein